MSGHSKWSQIKRAKEVQDHKKSQIFGKLSKDILLAMKQGTDPESNRALKDAITRARKENMPQANIDRLMSRHGEESQIEVVYEGFGPGGVAFLIAASTDSPNRTVSELRSIFKKHGGELGPQGSVQWKFNPDRTPKYPTTVSPEHVEGVQLLLKELEGHTDVVQVATDNLQ